jgi:hypothetical protein
MAIDLSGLDDGEGRVAEKKMRITTVIRSCNYQRKMPLQLCSISNSRSHITPHSPVSLRRPYALPHLPILHRWVSSKITKSATPQRLSGSVMLQPHLPSHERIFETQTRICNAQKFSKSRTEPFLNPNAHLYFLYLVCVPPHNINKFPPIPSPLVVVSLIKLDAYVEWCK